MLMPSTEAISEFDRWLTPDRIARSSFMDIIFHGLHDGSWDQDEAMALAMSAFQGFGNGNCYFLASAVACATGWPIVGILRPDRDLIHAAVVDPLSGDAFDILGRRPIVLMRHELTAAVGTARLAVLPSLQDQIDPDELKYLSWIAAGLPWMPVERASLDKKAWARLLTGYARTRGLLNEA
jgi:hypothetical protein